ncbi:hypothetical protein QBC46DRAFT_255939 [Diplogelasinospora grovesii]|uniref:Transposase n=1 Tax=Diplogelasinospora grovesii TaxID=303347 RepID=A0AAN6S669_9PEZI|nr:hypothetical protein QBC46DRAFT_255939 [Diplogelasinospora grovesii]
MFLSAFSFNNRTSLYPFIRDLKAKKGEVIARYILNALQEQLLTIYELSSIFTQNNAPTYTARIVQDWLQEWA